VKWTIKTSDNSKWTIEPNRKIIKTHKLQTLVNCMKRNDEHLKFPPFENEQVITKEVSTSKINQIQWPNFSAYGTSNLFILLWTLFLDFDLPILLQCRMLSPS
jgi:hypothetical protein